MSESSRIFFCLHAVLFLAEMELLHALHLVADGFQVAGAAVGGHTLQDLAETHGDVVDVLALLHQLGVIRVGCGDEDHLHRQDIGVLLVLADEIVADPFEADALLEGLAADAYLLTVALGAGADHVALGEDAVLDEVHVLDGPEGLLRVFHVVALDIAHPQQRDAGVGSGGLQLAQVRAVDHDLVLGHQLRRGGHAGEIHGGLVVAAQLVGGVPQHHQLEFAGILPCAPRCVVIAPGRGGADVLLHSPDNGVKQFHRSEFDIHILAVEDGVDLLIGPTQQLLIQVPEIDHEQHAGDSRQNGEYFEKDLAELTHRDNLL